MATTSIPPDVKPEPIPSDDSIIGGGGGPREPVDDSQREHERGPEPPVTPLSAYRTITLWTIVSIVMLFSTLTIVVKARWVDSEDWVSVQLPRVLYLNTAILALSSLTIELARLSLRTKRSRDCIRWIFATLVLGIAFLSGQIVAWRELVSRGLYLASNPGSFFIYLISGTHGLHLLGGIVALAFIAVFFERWGEGAKQETAVSVIALYWHFMDGLWFYLLALLFVTIQK
jgi:cytochrome c oxidase subunit III